MWPLKPDQLAQGAFVIIELVKGLKDMKLLTPRGIFTPDENPVAIEFTLNFDGTELK